MRLAGFLVLAALLGPVWAQEQGWARREIDRDLSEASRSFAAGDYAGGVRQVQQACEILRRNPEARPETNQVKLGATIAEAVNQDLSRSVENRNLALGMNQAFALRPLLDDLRRWDPANPRWDYQEARMWDSMSRLRGDSIGTFLQSAVQCADRGLGLNQGGDCRGGLLRIQARCTPLLQKWLRAARRNERPANGSPNIQTVYCSLCGGSHPVNFSCPYAGTQRDPNYDRKP
ncbi:MAG: hypothetical protein U0931_28345 [Vulcanimicrobiota bacterium]